jgi:AN1-like Zinc finger
MHHKARRDFIGVLGRNYKYSGAILQMEAEKRADPQAPVAERVVEEGTPPAAALRIKMVYAYDEKEVSVPTEGDLLANIKKAAHETFSLECLRLEVRGRPLLSAEQLAGDTCVEVHGIREKCRVPACRGRAARTGNSICKFCSFSFCLTHHLPEEHACDFIDECKKEAAEKNSVKLIEGKCPGSKGLWNL